jgi:hypothetical protein
MDYFRSEDTDYFGDGCPFPDRSVVIDTLHIKIIAMKNFLLVYRADYASMPQASPEQMQATTKRWMDWVGSIAAQNKLGDRGNRLEPGGKVVRPDLVITDGPYTEIKESLGGYSIVKADSIEEAVALAKGCPILSTGGNVEVREISVL